MQFTLQSEGENEKRGTCLVLCNEKPNELNSGHESMRT